MKKIHPDAVRMINTQLLLRGIKDRNILRVMGSIPREEFIPAEFRDRAYGDYPLPIGEDQTISQPYIVALMTELLELTGCEKVLELGTGSGYQAAVLAGLAGQVYTIERIAALSVRARKVIASLGIRNIHFKVGDGTEGWEGKAPFDRILITAATNRVPPPLIEQLAEGGRMILPLGERFVQTLTIVEKKEGKIQFTGLEPVSFVPLLGKYGME